MAISISGTTGISGVDGSSSAPALRGSDADTGISFGSNTAAITTDGVQRIHIDNNGKVILASNTDINGNMGFTGNMGVTGDIGVTGDLDLNGGYVSNIVTMSANDIDCSLGNYFIKTLNGSATFTFSNVPTNRSFALVIEIMHTSGTITWPASVKFPGNTAPTLTTGKAHLFVFVTDDGGSCFRGAALADYNY